LHRRAADWYAGNGSVTDAIKHYVAAWEPQRAAELAAQHWNDWLNRGFLSTVESWLARLPSELVRGDSRLCAAQALLRLDRGELTGVDPWLAAGDRAADPADPVAARDLAVLRALQRFKIGDLGAASNAARRVLELETGAQCFATTVALLVSGVSAFWAGRPGSAHQSLTSALQMARRTRNTLAETYAMGYLALSLTESGALEQATDAVAAALRVAAAPAVSEHFVACLPHLAAAALQAASGEPGAAVETSGRALALARRGAGQLETAVILGVHARARAAAGEDGSRWLARARAIVRSCPDPGDVSVRLARIRLPGGPRLDETNSRRDVPGTVVLSARERQLLPLLAGSLSQREIGVVLHLSINTVKTHSRVLFRKLGVSCRRAAVARARELELLPTTLPVPQMLSGAHPE
jgi:LuxR family maltose regulon positive regulatory protein